ncbi:MAG TPA: DNA-processing protein DprA [Candidatus Limnocylindrales bacterium]|nr:DNA-processing protein DprA [Candidatus Limnocylindrales bacterium]
MNKINKLTLGDKAFPAALLNIAQPPKQLYVLGDISPLTGKTVVSIVGSRAVTPYGKQVTTQLTRDLAKQGIAIVSGLALGVDGLAHQAALEVGGYTVAVLACGLDRFYPSAHHQLAKQILAQGGAIISEYPEGTEPYKLNFIERNRIVAGLCDGLLITEAAERSGTLHTANFALEQGKTVMAVPGNITSSNSRGTNNLIKTGAAPITSVDDILHALNLNQQTELISVVAANPEEALIINLLQSGTTDVNELQAASKLSPELFNQTLTMLEITGKIRPLGAAQWGLM